MTVSKTHHGSLLVVDDDKNVCHAMADFLRGRGHRTETAFNCMDAIERMREHPFEVVLCDVCLPDADGFHLLQWAVEHKPDTAVILIEDVTTKGGSVMQAVRAVRAQGATVKKIITIVDRLEGAAENLKREGLTLEAIFTAKELLS